MKPRFQKLFRQNWNHTATQIPFHFVHKAVRGGGTGAYSHGFKGEEICGYVGGRLGQDASFAGGLCDGKQAAHVGGFFAADHNNGFHLAEQLPKAFLPLRVVKLFKDKKGYKTFSFDQPKPVGQYTHSVFSKHLVSSHSGTASRNLANKPPAEPEAHSPRAYLEVPLPTSYLPQKNTANGSSGFARAAVYPRDRLRRSQSPICSLLSA